VISLGSLPSAEALLDEADFAIAFDFVTAAAFFLEFFDILSSQDVSMRATQAKRPNIFRLRKVRGLLGGSLTQRRKGWDGPATACGAREPDCDFQVSF
jgi:hypothetical protein